MKTASFFSYTGTSGISVALSQPRGMQYPCERLLNPTRNMLKIPETQYRQVYLEILSKLDPMATWEKLHSLVSPGTEPTLLCWEDLTKLDMWCHRTMIADWFLASIGQYVIEQNTCPKRSPISSISPRHHSPKSAVSHPGFCHSRRATTARSFRAPGCCGHEI